MLLELILLSELLQTPSGKFTFFGRNKAKETVIVVPVEPPAPKGVEIGAALVALTYPKGWDAQNVVVNLDPAQVEVYKQSIEVKKALRGL
jgi:hypothetical protein